MGHAWDIIDTESDAFMKCMLDDWIEGIEENKYLLQSVN